MLRMTDEKAEYLFPKPPSLYCPLKDGFVRCMKVECGWFNPERQMCAVVVLSYALLGIVELQKA